MGFLRREPLHERLAREGGLEPPARPVNTQPRWGEVGIHGVARPREWDTVVSVDADLPGDAASFLALGDGELVVEEGPEDPTPLAEAVERAVEPPYRAEAVRRGPQRWAVAARRIRVVRLERAGGDEIRLTVTPDGRELVVDGETQFGGLPELEALLGGDGVATASRIDGPLWELRIDPL